jgi:hypothetical protein
VLLGFIEQKVSDAEFAWVRGGLTAGFAKGLTDALADLTLPGVSRLTARRELGDDVIYSYEVTASGKAFLVHLGIAPDDKIRFSTSCRNNRAIDALRAIGRGFVIHKMTKVLCDTNQFGLIFVSPNKRYKQLGLEVDHAGPRRKSAGLAATIRNPTPFRCHVIRDIDGLARWSRDWPASTRPAADSGLPAEDCRNPVGENPAHTVTDQLRRLRGRVGKADQERRGAAGCRRR